MNHIPFVSAKRRLAALWLIGAGFIFFIILVQSILGHYEKKVGEIWQWFLPTVAPTLGLMLAVFAVDFQDRVRDAHPVEAFYYRLAFWLSVAYFVVVLLTLIGVNLPASPNYELLSQSNYWLATMQGFTSGTIGLFFVKKKEDASASVDRPSG
jgi:hypothetical protein